MLDFLTTKGKVLFGVTCVCVLLTIGMMAVNLLILANQNHKLSEENAALRQRIQLMQEVNELDKSVKDLESSMKAKGLVD